MIDYLPRGPLYVLHVQFPTLISSALLSPVQGAEVEVGESFLLLSGEAEGLRRRRQDWLELSELAVEVADIYGLSD